MGCMKGVPKKEGEAGMRQLEYLGKGIGVGEGGVEMVKQGDVGAGKRRERG